MDHGRQAFDNWSNKLALARVESYVFQTDPVTNDLAVDDDGNNIPTGLLNITMLDGTIPKKDVPYVIPAAGNTMFLGGLPELGVMCIVGWRQQNQPIILGFLPYGIDQTVRLRRTIPNIREGEILLQSSSRDTDLEKNQNFFRGARVWLDRYGRIRIDTTGYDLIIGYVLSNEFKSTVSYMSDPVTGNPVFLREKFTGGRSRRVDDHGNEVNEYGDSAYFNTVNDYNVTAQRSVNVLAFGSQTYQDRQGNLLQIDENGVIRLSSPAGSLEFNTQGSQNISVGGNVQSSVLGSVFQTIGDRLSTQVGKGGVDTEVAGKVDETVTGGDWTEKVSAGVKDIIAALGITLEVTSLTGKVVIGSSNANEPVPLGNTLVSALSRLAVILQTPVIGTSPPGGGPVAINPAIVTQLQQWALQYLTNIATNIVSRKVFTERG